MRNYVSALAVTIGLGLLATPAYGGTDPLAGDGLVVSESTISPGQTLVVAEKGAGPRATVKLTLRRSASSALGMARPVMAADSLLDGSAHTSGSLAQGDITLGVVTANRAGAWRVAITVPPKTVSGRYTLIAISDDNVLGVLVLHVLAAADVVIRVPFTSTGIIPGLAVGTGLIVAGGLLLLSVKHRRSLV